MALDLRLRFSILNRSGARVVTFGYLDGGDAVKTRSFIEKAIVEAKYVASPAWRSGVRVVFEVRRSKRRRGLARPRSPVASELAVFFLGIRRSSPVPVSARRAPPTGCVCHPKAQALLEFRPPRSALRRAQNARSQSAPRQQRASKPSRKAMTVYDQPACGSSVPDRRSLKNIACAYERRLLVHTPRVPRSYIRRLPGWS
jgi:hypothetical protein